MELAEEFYHASSTTKLPAQATLTYYGALNLVKSYICVMGKPLGDDIEHHGLSPSTVEGKTIKVGSRPRRSVSIFHEFCAALDAPVSGAVDLDLSECVSHIPELHEIAFRLGYLPDSRRHFLPVDVRILVDEDENWLFTEVAYAKKQITRVRTSRFLADARKAYFKEPYENDSGEIVHRCKRRKQMTWANFPRLFGNVFREYSKLDLAAVLTPMGYRYYCDLNKPLFHHLAYSLMMLFHVGTLTRYDPEATQSLLQGKQRPIVTEALEIVPKQMLYQLVSLMTRSTCVVPFAKLT